MSFESNLQDLKVFNSKVILSEEDKAKVKNLINLNDYNLEYHRVKKGVLDSYLHLRSSLLSKLSLPVLNLHLESLRRKNILLSIKEDAKKLITLNQYITHLIEEKKGPVDNLLDNLEYSEIYLKEASTELEKEIERKKKRRWIKRVMKVMGVVVIGMVIYLIWKVR
ncbi:hypothetical protein NBO_28g0010 [Nosema bombycis CQ1]|uniref:Uncharacterized protein n=1 Tax=Nosema bombycis (strain CQ1 / CVCC 102059) TaxID=578461 RepID=R0KU99_NOSB1|nr:hypothetical protein NBO_28g0010 [Nosema bombycis CQ1]|eukprot:EOB14371.1 hypothetical protein NBO_28g0010 [Nosema bombycis CQ1]